VTRRAARAVAVGALVAVVTCSGLSLASAAGPNPPTPTAPPDIPSRLALVSQDAWTVLGGMLHACLQIAELGSGEQLLVAVHQSVPTRSSFDSQQFGPVLTQVVLPVDALPTSTAGCRSVAIPLSSAAGAFGAGQLAVPGAGVYPLEVELRDSQELGLARFVTYLVAVTAGPGGQPVALTNKLGVAWVWPLATPPGLNPDGSIKATTATALDPAGRLGRQVAELAAHPTVPVTLAPSPETLDNWSSLARSDPGAALGAGTLRAAQQGGQDQVLGGPYVPIDLPSLLHGGLGSAADAETAQGQTSVDRFFGAHIDERTALALPTDGESIDRLRSQGVDQVVVAASAAAAGHSRLTSTSPFSLEPSANLTATGPLAAVADDDTLASTLTGPGVPALRAQRFLAGLALTALEAPGLPRADVVVNPDGYDGAAALVDAVLTGLTNNPWLSPTTLSGVYSTVAPAAGGDVRALAPYSPPAPPVSASAYNASSGRLLSFGSLVGPNDPRLLRGERFLLSSVSSAWADAGGSAAAHAQLAAVDTTIASFLNGIQIPAPGTITLTARSGAVPITFRNDTGQPIRVLVTLSSHKLDFPSGSTQTIALPTRSTTIRFEVRSRTSGTFPLAMSVRSADGSLLIAEGRFKVRSTVVSSVGLALAIGAGVFLLGWWVLDIVHRRRRRRPAAVVA
jgi:hypothetical protein